MTLGQTIRKLRKQSNIKAVELAEALNTSKSYISQYEHDKKKPSKEQLEKIADFLGYPVCAFEDTEYDAMVGMHRLFQLFQKYEGVIETDETIKAKVSEDTLEEGVYISLKSLSGFMITWFNKYEDWKNGEISEADFQEWMDRYTLDYEPSKTMRTAGALYDEKMNEMDATTDESD
ncbi:MAG: helix-turn-helix domain-containing protein [Lachnospiraceae bacterium]|nr:helix-turn-helix domain-containing protein [Lachnospiraceae bacterium]